MRQIASELLKNYCVEFSLRSPFTYASQLKGPLYCDNRKALSLVDVRNKIIDSFIKKIDQSTLSFDLIAGVATAGIPYATLIADRLNLPLIYVRSSAKTYGKKNQIEGSYCSQQKVLLIEDLINQGQSFYNASLILAEHNLYLTGGLCIMNYNMRESQDLFSEFSFPIFSLTDLDELLKIAEEKNVLSSREVDLFKIWRKDPLKWSYDHLQRMIK